MQLHYRLEALLEEAHIKVSSIVSDLLGISARRMLQALAGRRVLDQAANAAVKAKGTIFSPSYIAGSCPASDTRRRSGPSLTGYVD